MQLFNLKSKIVIGIVSGMVWVLRSSMFFKFSKNLQNNQNIYKTIKTRDPGRVSSSDA
jgi:hypothetical protein